MVDENVGDTTAPTMHVLGIGFGSQEELMTLPKKKKPLFTDRQVDRPTHGQWVND